VNLLRSEPALVGGLLASVLVLGAAYFLTTAQMIAAGALIPIVAGLFIRSQVVPVAKVEPVIPPPK
jgi:hypothetical protein